MLLAHVPVEGLAPAARDAEALPARATPVAGGQYDRPDAVGLVRALALGGRPGGAGRCPRNRQQGPPAPAAGGDQDGLRKPVARAVKGPARGCRVLDSDDSIDVSNV